MLLAVKVLFDSLFNLKPVELVEVSGKLPETWGTTTISALLAPDTSKITLSLVSRIFAVSCCTLKVCGNVFVTKGVEGLLKSKNAKWVNPRA